MTVQTDVLSATVTGTGTLIATARARIKSIVITTSNAGTGSVVLKDGGSGGTTKITVNTPAVNEIFNTLIPAEGVLFTTDVHATLSNVTSVTVFYG